MGKVVKNETRPFFQNLMVAGQDSSYYQELCMRAAVQNEAGPMWKENHIEQRW